MRDGVDAVMAFECAKGVPRRLKPIYGWGVDVRAEARTYLRNNGKSNSNSRFLPIRLHSGRGTTNKGGCGSAATSALP